MKKITWLLLLMSLAAQAQSNKLSLDTCITRSKRNFPLIKQSGLISEVEKNSRNSDNKNWLPKLSFITKASYQSEVVEFQGISFPKDNYLSALDLEQTLFDAGQTHRQKELDKLNSLTEEQKNKVELYKLIDRVNQLYSSILLSRANLKTLDIFKNELGNKKSNLSASVANGLVLQSSLEELEAEELKTEQSIIETRDNLQALYLSLAMFINGTVNDSTELSMVPLGGMVVGEEITRPEINLFNTQKSLLDARHKLLNKAAFPKLTLSAEGAYGRPGPNFLNQDLRFFGQAAVNLKWNVGSLYTLSNERQSISISKKMVDVQREVFEFNIRNAMTSQTAQINALKSVIEKDKLIVEKRHNISQTASAQLANGTITTSDYLTQLNAEMQAVLNEKVHEIKLMNAISNYSTTKGITNF